ncbi:hypothetical protein H4R33_006075 [Dimargaris cristalligena]|nr:hypothetical protein H4R33_006075 [Dimargaris cristalligena]
MLHKQTTDESGQRTRSGRLKNKSLFDVSPNKSLMWDLNSLAQDSAAQTYPSTDSGLDMDVSSSEGEGDGQDYPVYSPGSEDAELLDNGDHHPRSPPYSTGPDDSDPLSPELGGQRSPSFAEAMGDNDMDMVVDGAHAVSEEDDALLQELETIRRINKSLETISACLSGITNNVRSFHQTISQTKELVGTWGDIFSETHRVQSLLMDPNWQGATYDLETLEQIRLDEEQRRIEAEEEAHRVAEAAREEARRLAEAQAQAARAQAAESTLDTTTKSIRPRSKFGETPRYFVPKEANACQETDR